MAGPIIMELRMGLGMRGGGHSEAWIDGLKYLPLEEPTDFVHAAGLYALARKSAIAIRSAMDCLIAALAIRNDAHLLQCDRDFVHLARLAPLKLLDPAAVIRGRLGR